MRDARCGVGTEVGNGTARDKNEAGTEATGRVGWCCERSRLSCFGRDAGLEWRLKLISRRLVFRGGAAAAAARELQPNLILLDLDSNHCSHAGSVMTARKSYETEK